MEESKENSLADLKKYFAEREIKKSTTLRNSKNASYCFNCFKTFSMLKRRDTLYLPPLYFNGCRFCDKKDIYTRWDGYKKA